MNVDLRETQVFIHALVHQHAQVGKGRGKGGDSHRLTLQNTVLPKAIFDPP